MSPQALIVLGCRVAPDGTPSAPAIRRLARAVAAYRERPLPIVVSGGRAWGGALEATAFRRWLVTHGGIPGEQIWVECRSLSTAENARFSAAICRARGLDPVGVVTCDWHLPRAVAAFERMRIGAVGLAAPSPPASRTRRIVRALRERAAMLLEGCFARRWAA